MLSVISFANYFLSVHCLFVLLIVSFAVQKILSLIRKTLSREDTFFSMFTAAFTISKIWKWTKCPSAKEQIKMWYVYLHTHRHTHTHDEMQLRQKKEGIFTICSNTDRLGGYCAKCNKSDMITLTWQSGWKGNLGENGYHVYLQLSRTALHLKLSRLC